MLKCKLLKVEKPKPLRLEQLVENREPLYRGSAFVSTLSGNVHVLFFCFMIQRFIFAVKLFVLFIYQFLFSLSAHKCERSGETN